MFESCRAHSSVPCAGEEYGVLGHFAPNVCKRDTANSARNATDRLAVERQLVARFDVALDVQHTQAAIDLASIVLAGDRFLAGIAALREADVRLLETGFRREDALVELPAPARRAGLDPPAFELVFACLLAGGTLVE